MKISETISLLSWGRGKVFLHFILLILHLWNLNGYAVVIDNYENYQIGHYD